MYSLLIDTHSEKAIVVLYSNNKVLTIKESESNRTHSSNIMPMIAKVFTDNNITVMDLKEIYVVNGPGSFTGTRIGVTIAKTMAYTLNIPIKTITSLEVKAVSSSIVNTKLVVEQEKNGYFLGLFFKKHNKIEKKYFYLDKDEYKNYLKENLYGDELLDDVKINYQKVYDYLAHISSIHCHAVKPLYIKKIEVLND